MEIKKRTLFVLLINLSLATSFVYATPDQVEPVAELEKESTQHRSKFGYLIAGSLALVVGVCLVSKAFSSNTPSGPPADQTNRNVQINNLPNPAPLAKDLDANCTFCKVGQKTASGDITYETGAVMAFKNERKTADFHLIITKKHFTDITKMEPEDTPLACEIISVIQELSKGRNPKSIRIHTGASAGQTQFHMHWRLNVDDNIAPAATPQDTCKHCKINDADVVPCASKNIRVIRDGKNYILVPKRHIKDIMALNMNDQNDKNLIGEIIATLKELAQTLPGSKAFATQINTGPSVCQHLQVNMEVSG